MLQGIKPSALGLCYSGCNAGRFNKASKVILAFGLFVSLAACEAKLNLAQVEAEQEKPVHRFDNIQDIIGVGGELIAVGLGGVVLKSADNGVTWQRRELTVAKGDAPPSLIDIDACDDGRVVALDFSRRVWIASNGDWQPLALPVNEDPMSLECDPAGHVWVVGSFTTILRLGADGKTWDDLSLGEDAILSAVQFVSVNEGFIAGEFGTVLKTTDGGETWEAAPALENEFFPQAAYFESAVKGWVIGLQGVILRTDDGADTWVEEKTSTNAPLYSIAAGDGPLYVGGNLGTLLVYDRPSQSWRSAVAAAPAPTYLRAIHPVDSKTVIVGGGGLLSPVPVTSVQ